MNVFLLEKLIYAVYRPKSTKRIIWCQVMPKIFSFGSNGSGQLGIGHLKDVSEPVRVEIPIAGERYSVITVAAGGNHTVILLSNGYAYASGQNEDGRCSFVENLSFSTSMARVGFRDGIDVITESIRLCSATWQATAFVFENGNVYSCGTGNKGELGLGNYVTHASKLQMIKDFPPIGTRIVDIASSVSHTVAIISDGSAFGWGNGRKGQIGLPACNIWAPRVIESIPFKAQKAVCGRDFTLILGEPTDGFYVFLGLDKYGIQKSLPTHFPCWNKVDASWSSIYVLLKDSQILSFGRNDHNQLVPRRQKEFSHIAAGSEHFLGKTVNGELFARGWGEHGNCGIIQDKADQEWMFIPNFSEISYLAAGCATSWIVLN